MRIAYLVNNTYTDGMGGADHSLLNMLRELMRLGVEPICVLPKHTSLREPLKEVGATVVEAEYPNSLFLGGGRTAGFMRQQFAAFQEQRAARMLAMILGQHKVSIVHSNSAVIRVGAIAAGLAGVPHVWHIRESFEDLDRFFAAPGWGRYWKSMRSAAARIAVSNYAAGHLRERVPGNDVCVIYNGVIARASSAPSRNVLGPHEPFRVVVIGGLSKQKAPDIAVRAMRRLLDSDRSCVLELVGSGSRDWLEPLVEQLELTNHVVFTGRVDSPWNVLLDTDVLVSCGVGEAMGRVVAEAMCAGVPVVGRDSGATPEIVRRDRDGMLFETADELAECLMAIMQDYAKALEIARVARARAVELFTDERCAGDVLRLYERVLEAAA
ncbi:MAG: glycosyltransferase family 4 protein [Phycisphaerales bacterium]